MKSFTAIALESFPLIRQGDDIARIIIETTRKNNLQIEEGDIVAVAQKIFSKAENRIVSLKDVLPSRRSEEIAVVTGKNAEFVELVLRETERIVKASPEVLLVEDTRNLICVNAGIDKSNVEGKDNFTLLPEKPDISARKCRLKIKKLTGKNAGVIICDTYSRPFRRGQVNFAIGIAGIKPFKDYRGKGDLFGQILRVKNISIVDEIAAAAELLMGQGEEATPVVIFKGLDEWVLSENHDDFEIADLIISLDEDLFKDAL